jgi:AcrR family transcriptional regulator
MARQLGKQALLDAAAVLMDERGVDNVTLQDIGQASGHRNRSAVQYHFGSRVAVIQAVISQTMDPIDAERNMLLDHLESTRATLTTRSVLEVVVRPLARQLRSPEGRRYFRIGAQLINHPRFMTDAGGAVTVNTSIARCAAYLLPSLDHLPTPVVAERTSQVTGFIIRACGDQARLMDSNPPARPVLSVEDFTTNLVDTIMAILQAPTSVASAPAAPGPDAAGG